MTGVEEKPVAVVPLGIIWVEFQEFGVQYVYEVRAAHCAARMARFSLLYHSGCEESHIVCRFEVNCFLFHLLYKN